MSELPRPVRVTLDPRIAACPDLGDVVRVRPSAEPDVARHSGREGTVYGASLEVERLTEAGETLVGRVAPGETLVSVWFEDSQAVVWFPSRDVEFLRHEAFEMRIGDQVVVRDAEGTWHPSSPEEAVLRGAAARPRRGLWAWIRRCFRGGS